MTLRGPVVGVALTLALLVLPAPAAPQAQARAAQSSMQGGLPALEQRVRALEEAIAQLGGGLTSYDQLAGMPCTTAAGGTGTVHLAGLLKSSLCAVAISASGRFVDLGPAVFDTQTNLLWEKKDQAGGLHDVNNRYTWCVATGLSTSPAIGIDLCAGSPPSWISRVNADMFGGFSDWRVPTVAELMTIWDHNTCQPDTPQPDNPCLDPTVGSALWVGYETPFAGTLGGPYWATGMESGLFGFIVDFFGGSRIPTSFFPEFMGLEFPVRAVRTGP